MFSRQILLMVIIIFATGCSKKAESPPQHSEETLTQDEELVMFKTISSFTLECNGQYNLLINDKSSSGTQSFKLSVSPKELVVYMFDLDADGYIHGPHKNMNETITKIDGVNSDTLYFGALEINRNTLKYTSAATAGTCHKLETYTPIPTRQI